MVILLNIDGMFYPMKLNHNATFWLIFQFRSLNDISNKFLFKISVNKDICNTCIADPITNFQSIIVFYGNESAPS